MSVRPATKYESALLAVREAVTQALENAGDAREVRESGGGTFVDGFIVLETTCAGLPIRVTIAHRSA